MTVAKKKKKVARPAAKKTKRAPKNDIVELILADHKPLKQLIKVMKDSESKTFTERQEAYEEFVPLLLQHAKAEAAVLYVRMKEDEDLRAEACEGDLEHELAEEVASKAASSADDAADEDVASARIKVLAELVEHHIKEEEEEVLKDFRKNSEVDERVSMGEEYLRQKIEIGESGKPTSGSKKENAVSMFN